MIELIEHADTIETAGIAIAATGALVHQTWQSLAATGPVMTVSASVGEDIGDAATALRDYATETAAIQTRLDALRAQATDPVGGATLPFVHELTGVDPWNRLIGCGVLWLWRMTNHRGYPDGCQIEFARPGENWGVQLMCEASALTAHSLGPIDRLSNQSGRATHDHPST